MSQNSRNVGDSATRHLNSTATGPFELLIAAEGVLAAMHWLNVSPSVKQTLDQVAVELVNAHVARVRGQSLIEVLGPGEWADRFQDWLIYHEGFEVDFANNLAAWTANESQKIHEIAWSAYRRWQACRPEVPR